jgi:hypothetical protein
MTNFKALGVVGSSSVCLVHPAFVVGIFFQFVGVDVTAVLVEVDFAVLLAHVDLELTGGAAALPAIVVVAEAEVLLAETEGEAAARGELDVEEAAEGAGELEERAEGVRLLEKNGDGDEDVDGNEVLRLDADEEPEEEFEVAEEQGDGDEEAEDAGPCSAGDDVGTQVEDVSERDGGGEDSAADDGGEEELAEPAATVGGLEDGPGEPEGDHGEEDAEDALLHEGIGDELPYFAVCDGARLEEEMAEIDVELRGEPTQEEDGEKGADVREDELARCSFKSRETERDGAGARHVCFSYFIIGLAGGVAGR